jgi:putative flippase GtrA
VNPPATNGKDPPFFGCPAKGDRQTLGCVNWVLTAILVTVFSWGGLNYLIAKAVALVMTTASNYLLYRVWVFSDRRRST